MKRAQPEAKNPTESKRWGQKQLFDLHFFDFLIRRAALVAVGVALFCAPAAVRAQSFALDWFTLDGGGDTSTSAAYSVSGTIGQPDAGRLSSATYTVEGGFWGVVAEVPPRLSIALSPGAVIVSWPLAATGWVLEAAPTVTGPWTLVPGPYPADATRFYVTASPPLGTRFYRLGKL